MAAAYPENSLLIVGCELKSGQVEKLKFCSFDPTEMTLLPCDKLTHTPVTHPYLFRPLAQIGSKFYRICYSEEGPSKVKFLDLETNNTCEQADLRVTTTVFSGAVFKNKWIVLTDDYTICGIREEQVSRRKPKLSCPTYCSIENDRALVATDDGYVFGLSHDKCERYDIKTDEVCRVDNLRQFTKYFHATAIGKRIYICNEYIQDNSSKEESMLIIYMNKQVAHWERLKPQCDSKFKPLKVVEHEGGLAAFCDDWVIRFYNPQQNVWTTLVRIESPLEIGFLDMFSVETKNLVD